MELRIAERNRRRASPAAASRRRRPLPLDGAAAHALPARLSAEVWLLQRPFCARGLGRLCSCCVAAAAAAYWGDPHARRALDHADHRPAGAARLSLRAVPLSPSSELPGGVHRDRWRCRWSTPPGSPRSSSSLLNAVAAARFASAPRSARRPATTASLARAPAVPGVRRAEIMPPTESSPQWRRRASRLEGPLTPDMRLVEDPAARLDPPADAGGGGREPLPHPPRRGGRGGDRDRRRPGRHRAAGSSCLATAGDDSSSCWPAHATWTSGGADGRAALPRPARERAPGSAGRALYRRARGGRRAGCSSSGVRARRPGRPGLSHRPRVLRRPFRRSSPAAVPVPLYPPVRLGRARRVPRGAPPRMLRARRGARLVLADRAGEAHPRRERSARPGRPSAAARSTSCRAPTACRSVASRARTTGAGSVLLRHHGRPQAGRPVATAPSSRRREILNSFWPDTPELRHSCVSWLPLYHDMGLIGCVFPALAPARELTLIGPELFVARPGALAARDLALPRHDLAGAQLRLWPLRAPHRRRRDGRCRPLLLAGGAQRRRGGGAFGAARASSTVSPAGASGRRR